MTGQDNTYTIQINATLAQVEEFKSSILWQDICRELECWSEGFKREMASIVDDAANTNPSSASVLLHMGDINGRMKAVQYFLGILDLIEDVIKSNKPELENVEEEDGL